MKIKVIKAPFEKRLSNTQTVIFRKEGTYETTKEIGEAAIKAGNAEEVKPKGEGKDSSSSAPKK